MMRWFGPPRGQEPVASGLELIAVPVGEPCGWCEEPIEAQDSGVTVPLLSDRQPPRELAYHFECHARQTLGSVAHLQRRCSCFVPGATRTDPPDMTKREAARAALVLFQNRRV